MCLTHDNNFDDDHDTINQCSMFSANISIAYNLKRRNQSDLRDPGRERDPAGQNFDYSVG